MAFKLDTYEFREAFMYCVKCRKKQSSQEYVVKTMKNGKPATQGICVVCGTKMFSLGNTPQTIALAEKQNDRAKLLGVLQSKI